VADTGENGPTADGAIVVGGADVAVEAVEAGGVETDPVDAGAADALVLVPAPE
jgi:hypothetical protein